MSRMQTDSRKTYAPAAAAILAAAVGIQVPVSPAAEPGSAPLVESGSEDRSIGRYLPNLEVGPELEQELRWLETRLGNAREAGDFQQAAGIAEELHLLCDLCFGPESWQSRKAHQIRREAQRMQLLSEADKARIREASARANRARILFVEGKIHEAYATALKARQTLRQLLGSCAPSHVGAVELLVEIAYSARQMPEAERLVLECLAIAERKSPLWFTTLPLQVFYRPRTAQRRGRAGTRGNRVAYAAVQDKASDGGGFRHGLA